MILKVFDFDSFWPRSPPAIASHPPFFLRLSLPEPREDDLLFLPEEDLLFLLEPGGAIGL